VRCARSTTFAFPHADGGFLLGLGLTLVLLARSLVKCHPGRNGSILATDISTRILAAASAGVYPEARLAGLPDGYAKRWFQAPRSRAPGSSEVRAEIRSMVRFHRLNLAEPPFPMQGPLDAIFVRNVMIYFDNAVRSALVAECRRLLKPGGYLLIGHAETLGGMAEGFKCLKPSVYRKQG
jgi:chemotaxis protein methyltransferase CheR